MTPEASSRSAGRNAAYGVRSEIVISTGVSSMRARMCAMSHPTATPMITPPRIAPANRTIAPAGEKTAPAATARAAA